MAFLVLINLASFTLSDQANLYNYIKILIHILTISTKLVTLSSGLISVTRLRLSQQASFESYFLQVSHILAAVFPQVADKPYIGANCITLYVFSSAMITRGD